MPGLALDRARDTAMTVTALGPPRGAHNPARRRSANNWLDDRIIPGCDRRFERNTQTDGRAGGPLNGEVRKGTLVRAGTEPGPEQWKGVWR